MFLETDTRLTWFFCFKIDWIAIPQITFPVHAIRFYMFEWLDLFLYSLLQSFKLL